MLYLLKLYQKLFFLLNLKNLHQPYHAEKKLYLTHFCKYILHLLFFFNFWILSLSSVNGPQTLSVNPGCFKCISGINLSPANKNVFTVSLSFLYGQQSCTEWNCIQNKISLYNDALLNGIVIPKSINSPFASCFFNKSWFFTAICWIFW